MQQLTQRLERTWVLPRVTLRQLGAALCAAAAAQAVVAGGLLPFGPALALGISQPLFPAVWLGAALGVAVGAPGPQKLPLLAALAGCAVLRRQQPHRFYAACAGCCAAWLGSALGLWLAGAGGWRQLPAAAGGAMLAVGLGWAVRRWPVTAADPAEAAARPVLSTAAARLSAVAESLSGIAQTVDGVYRVMPPKGETYNRVVESTHDELCVHCNRRQQCWQKEYSNTVDGLFAVKPLLEQQGRVGVEHLPGQLCRCIHPAALASAVTRAYTLYRGRQEARVHADALRTALTEQYGAVADALAGLSAQLGEPGVTDPYKSGQVAALFAAMGSEPQECAVTRDGCGRLRAAVTLPRTGFTTAELKQLAQAVGRICRRAMDTPQKLSCKEMTTLIFSEKPRFAVVFGAAGQAAGEVSGDAVQQFCAAGTARMILCDGMGTGKPAAVDGNLAAELTARLLKAGFSAETAARLVNVALAMKGDEESCATLDLASVDLYTGTAALYKAGAAPGFVVQGGKLRTVGQKGLPVGILGAVNAESRQLQLAAGDWLVLVSDGALEGGADRLAAEIARAVQNGSSPRQLAEQLVAAAAARPTAHPDDVTAAVLRLEAAE